MYNVYIQVNLLPTFIAKHLDLDRSGSLNGYAATLLHIILVFLSKKKVRETTKRLNANFFIQT